MSVKNSLYNCQFFDAKRIAKFRDNEIAKYGIDYFKNDYWKEDIPGMSGNHGFSYSDPDHIQRFELLWSGIETIAKGSSFLDVGCGTGVLVEVALKNGVAILGVDSAMAAVEEFQKRTQRRWPKAVIQGNSTSLSFANASFDVLLCFDVLEHLIVFDIFDAVSELCRVASKQIIASINLDNPYKYHPTILSRETWIAMFEATGKVVLNQSFTEKISKIVCDSRPEYDFFIFDRI